MKNKILLYKVKFYKWIGEKQRERKRKNDFKFCVKCLKREIVKHMKLGDETARCSIPVGQTDEVTKYFMQKGYDIKFVKKYRDEDYTMWEKYDISWGKEI